jgi:DNA-directed RNA polymerase II subunit RPB11
LQDKRVIFAGYRMPHPLEHEFILKIQTTPDTTPIKVFQDTIMSLTIEINEILRSFQDNITGFSL